MQQVRMLIQLLEKGHSLRFIADQLSLARQTVRLYVHRLDRSSYSLEELRGLPDGELAGIVYCSPPAPEQKVDPRREEYNALIPRFLAELKRRGVTRRLLWEEYSREARLPYRYTQFCVLLKEASKLREATLRLVHQPAANMMIDFAGDKLSYVDDQSGEVHPCPVLVTVLPFSKYTFSIPLYDATIPNTVKGLTAAMEYFGGATQSLTTDNMPQIVSRSCRYEPVFTDAMRQWALHYRVTLLATRPGRPRDKAAVENEVKIAYRRIYAPLRDRVFHSLSELQQAVLQQVELHNNTAFQLHDHSRREIFEREEKPLLQSLPATPFLLKHQVTAHVQKNYHITLGENWHHYSVPYLYIGKKVSAVYDTDVVEVYYQHQRIAVHRRSYKRHGFSTVAEHMPPKHEHYYIQQGWTADYFLQQAGLIGPATTRYMEQLLASRAYTEQTYHACRGILRLHKDFGSRIESACLRALTGNTFNYRTVHNILSRNLDQAPLPGGAMQPDLFRLPEHTNLRGPEAYR